MKRFLDTYKIFNLKSNILIKMNSFFLLNLKLQFVLKTLKSFVLTFVFQIKKVITVFLVPRK